MKERYRRQSFLGKGSDSILENCTAAFIGLGGGGGHLVQQCAHLGLGNFLLVDPDRVEESNLNRLVGATAKDAANRVLKALVANRLIKRINPHATVQVVSQKWQECHALLRGCDVIFGSVDTYRERFELEITARRYLIPYIDVGMDVHSVGERFFVSGQVILSMPGALCMRCLGFLRDDLLAREAENYGAAGDRPQVVWANGILASAAVGVFTQLITPWHANHSTTVYLEYEGNTQTLASSSRLECMKDRRCSHFSDFRDLGDPFWAPESVEHSLK